MQEHHHHQQNNNEKKHMLHGKASFPFFKEPIIVTKDTMW